MPDKQNWFGWCSMALTIDIVVLWFGNTPMFMDDFFYQRMPGPDEAHGFWKGEGEYITSFSQVPEAIANHRAEVNGRFANLTLLALQPLPYQLLKWLVAIVLGIMVWLLWRWSGKESLRNNVLALIIPLLFWTGLQWYSSMQSTDFQFNYMLPSVMMVILLMQFWQKKGRPQWWAWLLLAIFSIWHECFTIAFGFFLGAQWLFRRRWTTLIAIAVLVAGAFVQFSVGTAGRMDGFLEGAGQLHLTLHVSSAWVSLVAFLLWALAYRWIKYDQRRDINLFGIGLIASWVAMAIIIVLLSPPQRAHWPNDVMAILFILLIIRNLPNVKINRYLKAAMIVLYILWGATLVIWQCRIRDYSEYLQSELRSGNTIIADKDGFSERKVPFWLMGITSQIYKLSNCHDVSSLAKCVTPQHSESCIIIPEEFVGKTFDQWPKVPGDNDFRYASNGMMARRHDGLDLSKTTVNATFGPPSLSMSPIDYAVAALRGHMNAPKREVGFFKIYKIEANGDSLDVLFYNQMTRSLLERPIVAVDVPKIKGDE